MKRYDYLTEAFGIVFTIAQTREIFQLISLILTCVSIAFSLCFTLYNWYKKAIADKSITKDEIKEGVEIVKDHVEKFTEVAEEIKKDDK